MSRRPVRLVCEGPLHWSLGGEYLLIALRRALDAGACLTLDFVGDGPDRERLVYTAHDLRLEERVAFLAAGSQRGDARALVLPVVADRDWPALPRARRAGLAVVCSDLPELCRTTADDPAIVRVPPRDPEALAEALLGLAERPGPRGP